MHTQTAGKSKLRNNGSGPGEQTLDGCPVEFYLRLPTGNEVARVVEAWAPPATLLELGAGCGRLTLPLTNAGYSVTAVDNSAEMLKHIDCAETVLADIESLQLGTSFDVVLLASHLLNCPDAAIRNAMLSAARAHLRVGGILLLEIHPENILQVAAGDNYSGKNYSARIVSSEIRGRQARITIEYHISGDSWRHSFETEYLSPDQIGSSLRKNGFKIASWLDSDKSWLKAVAV